MGGVSEAIYITAHKPTLNRGGGGKQLFSNLEEAGQVTGQVTWTRLWQRTSSEFYHLWCVKNEKVGIKITKILHNLVYPLKILIFIAKQYVALNSYL